MIFINNAFDFNSQIYADNFQNFILSLKLSPAQHLLLQVWFADQQHGHHLETW